MYVTQGKIAYYSDYCVAYIDREVARYYRSLIPAYHYVSPQKYSTHVTVVRKLKEVVDTDHDSWRKYEGISIPIYYEQVIRYGVEYYWLDAFSPALCAIRRELGLSPYREGYDKFHITIGNSKQ